MIAGLALPPWLADLGPGGLDSGALGPGSLAWLVAVTALAGMVRGFSGFGTALVFLPLAALVLHPVAALVILLALDIGGPLVNLPRALAEGQPRQILVLSAGMVAGLIPGVAILLVLPPEAFRWGVSGVALVAAGLLASGWRWRGSRGPGVQAGVGALSGFLGGSTGLSGPPVVAYYLASRAPAAVVRANMILYLFAVDLALLALLGLRGQIDAGMLGAAALLMPVFLLANAGGARGFHALRGPDRVYRLAALGLICGAALVGLPLWD
jgi:uncharacterized protein